MDERRLAERGEGGVESVRVQVHVGRGDGDAGYLCRMLMLEKYPVSRVDQTIAEQDDVVMVGEVEGLLSNYRALLVTLPVERVFKQNYHSFKRLE